MGDIDIGLHCRMIDLIQESHHILNVVQERKFEWLEFERDLSPELRCVLAQFTKVLHCRLPLLGGRDDFLLPNIFAQHKQDVLGIIFVCQVQIGPAALEMKTLHSRIEINEAKRNASNANYW